MCFDRSLYTDLDVIQTNFVPFPSNNFPVGSYTVYYTLNKHSQRNVQANYGGRYGSERVWFEQSNDKI